MRITIITVGSCGDVQPYMALGLGLQKSGHRVCLATHETFEKEILSLRMDFSPLEGNMRELVDTGAVRDVTEAGGNPFLFASRFAHAAEPLVRQAMKDMLAACEEAEAAILAGLGFYGGYDVAQKLDIPFADPPSEAQPGSAVPCNIDCCERRGHAFASRFFRSTDSNGRRGWKCG